MIKDILKGIEDLKLVCSSDELIEVRMEQLEVLYTYIRRIYSERETMIANICSRDKHISTLNGRIDVLNDIAKCTLNHKSLDEYM